MPGCTTNVRELIELAKNQPLNLRSSGSDASSHLSGELFNTLGGVKTQDGFTTRADPSHPQSAGRARTDRSSTTTFGASAGEAGRTQGPGRDERQVLAGRAKYPDHRRTGIAWL